MNDQRPNVSERDRRRPAGMGRGPQWRFYLILMSALLAGNESAAETRAEFEAMARDVSREVTTAAPVRFLGSVRFGRDKDIAQFELGNGLRIILLEDHSAPVLSYQTWYGVGSRFEKRGKTGIAHLFEHLMFKGTENYPHDVFDRIFEEAGAQVNAATWLDWTFYFENLPAGQLELAARLESDRMVRLVINQAQLDSEREVVKNERRFRVDNDPDGIIDETLLSMVFPSHPYGMPTIGYMADIDSLTLEDCLTFYRTYYSPGNATLVIVGDVEARETLVTVAKQYGDIPKVKIPPSNPPPEKEQEKAQTKTLTLPVASEKARMAWRAVPATDDDVHSLDVANEVLFSNESSRVYRILVEEKGLASDVDGAMEAFRLDGLFVVDLVMNTGKKAEEAVEVVLGEVERLAREGPTEVELARAKNHMEAAFQRSLASVGSRATQLGMYELTAGDYRGMFTFVDQVRSVTAADVQKMVGKLLTRNRISIVYGKPGKNGQ